MIQPSQDAGSALPPETAMSEIVTQKDLDECARALGRPLWTHEFKILERLLMERHEFNQQVKLQGRTHEMRSLDELVHFFIKRVQLAEAKKMVKGFVDSGGIGYK